MKTFRQFSEDAPANAAGTGGIAGIGVGPKGEPGVDLRKKKMFDESSDQLLQSAEFNGVAYQLWKLSSGGYQYRMIDTDDNRLITAVRHPSSLEPVQKRYDHDVNYAKLTEEIDPETREAAAKAVHDAWMDHQKEQGHTSHKSPDGKEEYMKPYEDLSKPAKDLDRMAVDAVIQAIEQVDEETETFAGARVFEVDSDRWMKSRFGKGRYHRYDKYVGKDEVGEEIRQFGRTSKDDIILKDSTTAVMTFLRRKQSRP